jgi:endonuclease YncB( thermonuclease family)
MKKFPLCLTLLLFAPGVGLWQPSAVLAEENALVLGTYELDRNNGVVDGDTIKCWKLDGSVRLLAVDAEETFHALEDRIDAGRGWEAYAAKKAADNDLPVKYGSFIGEEGWHWAREFFRGVKAVRLEYDSLDRKKDIYGRHLCYAFATPNGAKAEQNFCVELVRAGYSPYSMKYGHSVRFRKEFEQAEKEAREAKRGIWWEKPMGYRDYDVRLKWWKSRADQLDTWAAKDGKVANAIDLAADNGPERLKALSGKEVVLLCNMPERPDGLGADDTPPRIKFTAGDRLSVTAYFDGTGRWDECKPDSVRGWYVVVRGKLEPDGDNWKITVKKTTDFAKA